MEKVRYMISDAANLVNVETHVLRYWEDELALTIPRNEMGHRYYTKENIKEFQKIKEQFYEEVVYAENGPGADEYRKYYEEMDPATAEALYKQVIQTEAADKQMQEYANTFSNMQASEAAAILGNMTDNLDLAASILQNLDVSTRGAILGAMDSAIAARIVKIMDPNS